MRDVTRPTQQACWTNAQAVEATRPSPGARPQHRRRRESHERQQASSTRIESCLRKKARPSVWMNPSAQTRGVLLLLLYRWVHLPHHPLPARAQQQFGVGRMRHLTTRHPFAMPQASGHPVHLRAACQQNLCVCVWTKGCTCQKGCQAHVTNTHQITHAGCGITEPCLA